MLCHFSQCLTLCDPMDCSLPESLLGFSRQEYRSELPCLPPGISQDNTHTIFLRLLTFLGGQISFKTVNFSGIHQYEQSLSKLKQHSTNF